jgi:ppGpp synthetase/RelA/SpoT-type nucleotidyltranferase
VIDLEEVRRQWEKDQPEFEAFGRAVARRLITAVQRTGINAAVSFRTKQIDSLLKKLILKPQYSYATLGDKVGIRVVVRYRQEVHRIVSVAQELFSCGEPEDTAERLAEDRVGYLSTHIDVMLTAKDRAATRFPVDRYRAELQVRTLAQHLWSEMSHDTTYKSGNVVEPDLKRRVNLLAGLIEVVDREFSRLEEEFSRVEAIPEVKLLKALEGQYFKLGAQKGDTDLSLDVIRNLWPLYRKTPDEIQSHLDEVFAEKSAVFKTVFADATAAPRGRSAFLFQPEVLMIYDLLHSQQYDLRRTWTQHYPERELELLAIAFGMSFE